MVQVGDIGFNSDYNAVALFTALGSEITLEGSKRVVAESLIAAFTEMLESKATNIMGTTNG